MREEANEGATKVSVRNVSVSQFVNIRVRDIPVGTYFYGKPWEACYGLYYRSAYEVRLVEDLRIGWERSGGTHRYLRTHILLEDICVSDYRPVRKVTIVVEE